MSPRPRSSTPIADLIAEAVRGALAAQGQHQVTPTARRGRPRAASASGHAVTARTLTLSKAEGASTAATAHSAGATGQQPPAAATPATPPALSAAAQARAAQNELLDRVRADLKAAFDGRPVSPDRLAFRLKVDRDLVDAALTYLVTRKEARAKWIRGRVSYTPALPGLGN